MRGSAKGVKAVKGMQAILFAESFNNKFKPMSCDRPKCLFPLANIPLLLYSLEFLAINNVTEAIIVSTKESRVFKPVIETIKAAHSNKLNRLQITTFKLDKAKSVAAALREIHEAQSQIKLKEDFIIMQGDVVSNARLQAAIDMHMGAKKSKSKDGGESASVILTKIFAPIPYANPIRDPS